MLLENDVHDTVADLAADGWALYRGYWATF